MHPWSWVKYASEARASVARKAQADAYPQLTDSEMEEIVQRHRRASFWKPSTAYDQGERIQVFQTPQNVRWWPADVPPHGVYFRCLSPGTSGSTEPFWLGSGGFFVSPLGVIDGGSLWRYDGPAFLDLFDIGAAVHDAWMLKAAKVAPKYDITSAQQSMRRSQMYDHCLRMANRYAPLYVA